ncbi:hypothetical protein T484DRAFT_1909727, partial [Baffinella frigidus]
MPEPSAQWPQMRAAHSPLKLSPPAPPVQVSSLGRSQASSLGEDEEGPSKLIGGWYHGMPRLLVRGGGMLHVAKGPDGARNEKWWVSPPEFSAFLAHGLMLTKQQAGEVARKLDAEANTSARAIRAQEGGQVDVVAFMDWWAAHALAPVRVRLSLAQNFEEVCWSDPAKALFSLRLAHSMADALQVPPTRVQSLFSLRLAHSMADALQVPPTRVQVLDVQKGSVVATVVLDVQKGSVVATVVLLPHAFHENAAHSRPPTELAQALIAQCADPNP